MPKFNTSRLCTEHRIIRAKLPVNKKAHTVLPQHAYNKPDINIRLLGGAC